MVTPKPNSTTPTKAASYGSITSYKSEKILKLFWSRNMFNKCCHQESLVTANTWDTFKYPLSTGLHVCTHLLIECHHWLYHLITQHWIQCGDDKLEIFLSQWLHIHLPMMVTMVTTCIWLSHTTYIPWKIDLEMIWEAPFYHCLDIVGSDRQTILCLSALKRSCPTRGYRSEDMYISMDKSLLNMLCGYCLLLLCDPSKHLNPPVLTEMLNSSKCT